MVRAMAPKAPNGATFMMILIMANNPSSRDWIPFKRGFDFSPIFDKANPSKTEKNNTCRILLVDRLALAFGNEIFY